MCSWYLPRQGFLIFKKMMTYRLNISETAFDGKPDEGEIRRTYYSTRSVTLPELCDYISSGYNFTGIFSKPVKGSPKKETFVESPYIGIDCDNMKVSMTDFCESLPIKPSIAYTTPSNMKTIKGVFKGYRFRLIYLLSETLKSEKEVKNKYYGLLNLLHIDNVIKDNCGSSCARYFNGSKGCELIKSDTVLNPDEIPVIEKEKTVTVTRELVYETDSSDVFLKEYFSTPVPEFLLKYSSDYGDYKRRTDVTPNEYGIEELDESYCEISLNRCISRDGYIKKIKEGDRTKTLFAIGCSLRYINPSIDFKGLLYALTEFVFSYFENTDGQCNRRWIVRQTRAILKVKDVQNRFFTKKKFQVPDSLVLETGLSKKTLSEEYKRTMKDKQIFYFFDGLKSDKENIAVLKENGVSVSPAYLKSFRERHNLVRRTLQLERIESFLKEGLSVKEIISRLGITRKSYYNLINESV